jgi:hypothetical protein
MKVLVAVPDYRRLVPVPLIARVSIIHALSPEPVARRQFGEITYRLCLRNTLKLYIHKFLTPKSHE